MQARILKISLYKRKFLFPIDLIRTHLSTDIISERDFYNVNNFFFSKKLFKEQEIGKILKVNRTRLENSYIKIALARTFLPLLVQIPFVEAVFITGSVASLNAKPKDDIDLWIITSPKRIWLSRFLDTKLLEPFNAKRRKYQKNIKNKLCINFYKSTGDLTLQKKNIEFATQFVEAIPLYFKSLKFYKKLLLSNSWLQRYYKEWFTNELNYLNTVDLAQTYLFSNDFVKRYSREVKRILISKGLTEDTIKQLLSGDIRGTSKVLYKLMNIRNVKLLNLLEYILGVFQIHNATANWVFKPSNVFTDELTTWDNIFRYKR